ncbi:D-ribose pyranase [Spirabiliibacterium falconis]|uniref:D-ribose pyranase n=1 Tax=Spirabiliibacterium falconis TaxID=572023 RepID=UPI001AAC4E50|nr:D-ribose pyranase [Spirabiliibacterium falconis]MBE2893758.1 D-ribose pyranase [Spirabiliibacterium falconis]
MKKTALLNQPISSLIASLGHTDSLVICDAGLPIPTHSTRIDLALTSGVPSFIQTVQAVSSELFIESAVIAEEIKQHSPAMHTQLLTLLTLIEQQQQRKISVTYVTHAIFKQQTQQAKGIIRTGECTPYANIILHSGVPF